MAESEIRVLDPQADLAAVQDLRVRAADYIVLETGTPPTQNYAAKFMAEARPNLPSEDVFSFGALEQDENCGIVICLRNFYEQGELYMGLLLLDPGARGAGLGSCMARHV